MIATFNAPQMSASIESASLSAETGIPVARELIEREAYTGDYDITPSSEEIVLNTQYLRMTDNVRIAPIPSNYGLINWNGTTLTVS